MQQTYISKFKEANPENQKRCGAGSFTYVDVYDPFSIPPMDAIPSRDESAWLGACDSLGGVGGVRVLLGPASFEVVWPLVVAPLVVNVAVDIFSGPFDEEGREGIVWGMEVSTGVPQRACFRRIKYTL